MDALRLAVLRTSNALRRVASGLPASGRTLSPEVPNDLFQAHRSLYLFCKRFASGKRVLDLGCGTGYGTPELLAGGALEVLGIDRDPRAVRYAERRFGRGAAGRARFRTGAPGAPPPEPGPFDLVLALGVLPRVPEPGPALDTIRGLVAPGGSLIAALPPILDGQALELHRARADEPSSLYLWDWESELADRFPRVRLFRHLPPDGRLPDLADPRPSTLDAAAYRFEEIPRAEIYDVGSLTALFVCEA